MKFCVWGHVQRRASDIWAVQSAYAARYHVYEVFFHSKRLRL